MLCCKVLDEPLCRPAVRQLGYQFFHSYGHALESTPVRNAEQITRLTFEVEPAAHKQKLAEFLFEKLSSLSKMYIRELIRDGLCEVNGVHANSGYRLTPNDFTEIEADTSPGAIVTYTGMRRTTGRANPADRLWVYGRVGEPCRRCAAPVQATKQGPDARTTYWCARCQA